MSSSSQHSKFIETRFCSERRQQKTERKIKFAYLNSSFGRSRPKWKLHLCRQRAKGKNRSSSKCFIVVIDTLGLLTPVERPLLRWLYSVVANCVRFNGQHQNENVARKTNWEKPNGRKKKCRSRRQCIHLSLVSICIQMLNLCAFCFDKYNY